MNPSISEAEAQAVTHRFLELAASIPRADLALTGLLSAYATIAANGSPSMLEGCTEGLERTLRVFKDIAQVRAALKH